MADIKDSTIKSKPRKRRYFLVCFGFSEKKQSHDVVKSGPSRKKNRFLSWSRFRMKKSAVKTVPVDTAVPEKLGGATEIEEVPAAGPDQIINNKPHKNRYENSQNILLESRETLDATQNNTCQKAIPFGRKKETNRKTISHQSSLDSRKKSGVTNKVLSHSASFPAIQLAGDSRITKDKSHERSQIIAAKLEPVVGMSIIMVTLIIMVIWGKLCAILCTSAWFYIVPRLRKNVDSNNVGIKNGGLKLAVSDMNSEEYKKKVVLEGLLRRSHRNVAGVL